MPENHGMARLAAWLAFAFLVGLLDQISKDAVLAWMEPGRVVPITGFFDLVLTFNSGAAFSLFAEHSGWQRWFLTALATVAISWLIVLIYQYRHEKLLPACFALIIGGALGNVVDRINHGAVVDFLYFHAGTYGWPAFNLADSAITLGVILMLVAQFRGKAKTSATPHPEQARN
jgi:signal peptidase II